MHILISQLNFTIGDFPKNKDKILSAISYGKKQGAEIVLFSELTITGYPPQDFLLMPSFVEKAMQTLEAIIPETKDIAVIIGLPRTNPGPNEKKLFNSAAIIENGILLGFQDKTLLPTYDVFDERRYFEPSSHPLSVWNIAGKLVGVTICEDIWQHSDLLEETNYQRDPILELKGAPIHCMLNLSASPFSLGKEKRRLKACTKAAKTLHCPLILCNQVGGYDSLIFDGHSLCISANGSILAWGKGFQEDLLLVDTTSQQAISPKLLHLEPAISSHRNLPSKKNTSASTNSSDHKNAEILYQALALGVKDYFEKSGFTRACIGLSGGIDSAIVACIAVEALGAANVLGVSMPSRYSSESSREDACQLAENLGIAYQTFPIEAPFQSYLTMLEKELMHSEGGLTEENLQARIRGMLLMALSNRHGYIVLSTGNKSELAVGYSTLYGDMCGGLAVISDVTKRQVYGLARWINREHEVIPKSTLLKAPSAELRPNQLDSDSLPEYDILDNVIESYIEKHLSAETIATKFDYPLSLVQELIRKIHHSEYKRRQSAPSLRITEKSFSIGRHFPIVQGYVK